MFIYANKVNTYESPYTMIPSYFQIQVCRYQYDYNLPSKKLCHLHGKFRPASYQIQLMMSKWVFSNHQNFCFLL